MLCEIGSEAAVAASSGGIFGYAIEIGEYAHAQTVCGFMAFAAEHQNVFGPCIRHQCEVRILVDLRALECIHILQRHDEVRETG